MRWTARDEVSTNAAALPSIERPWTTPHPPSCVIPILANLTSCPHRFSARQVSVVYHGRWWNSVGSASIRIPMVLSAILLTSSFSATLSQPHSCSEAALSLLTCLEESKCVKEDGRTMYECLKDPVESEDCKAVRNAYTMCKHGE